MNEETQNEEREDATDLPRRAAMSLLVDPSSLICGGLLPNSPTSPTAPGAPTAGTPPTAPHVPVPEANPGGTYQPDTSTTSKG